MVLKQTKKQQLANDKALTSIIAYIKRMNKSVSNRQVYSLEKIPRRTFENAKKQFSINLQKMIDYCNSLEAKEKDLILDYTLISQEMKIIDRPYNLIYNHNSKSKEPCLVLLFAILRVDDKIFPLSFDYWIQDIMLEENELYLTKTEIAQAMINNIITKELLFDYVSFDAGFCSPELLQFIDSKDKKFICRFPKSRKFTINSEVEKDRTETAQSIFKNEHNGSFYYDRMFGFERFVYCQYADLNIQLILVANSKDKLVNRDFYCVITNDLELRYTQVLRRYKNRNCIEFFLKT